MLKIFSALPQTACVRQVHANIHLILIAPQRKYITVPIDFYGFIASIVCSSESNQCRSPLCYNCQDNINHYSLTHFMDGSDEEDVQLYQWERDTDFRIVKVLNYAPYNSIYHMLKEKFFNLLLFTPL